MLSYGNFTITNWTGAFGKMKELGPDLLATTKPLTDVHPTVQQYLPREFFEYATLEKFTNVIRMGRRSKMLLCVFLLKHQEYFSGIGNYLKAQILYESKLHPNRTLGSLSTDDISILFTKCLSVIAHAYECGGLTHGTFLDPDMEKGTYPVSVYKKKGELDPNGYVIKKIKTKDGRSTYIVEEVQK